MTLADEDTNSILTDNANRAIQGNVAMQIIQSDYQEIRTCICERNAKLILRNTGNLKLTKSISLEIKQSVTKPGGKLLQVAPSGGQYINS